MKVLFLASDPALGPDVPFGDSIRVRLLLEALHSRGADVDVRWAGPAQAPTTVAPPTKRALPDFLRPIARDIRALIHAIAFRRRLAGFDDVDVVFEFASYLAPVGLSVARRLRVPYVVEVEGPLASLRYEDGASPLRRLGDALERRRLRGADAVIAVSAPLARWLDERGATQTQVLPNVANPQLFEPDSARRDTARRRLGLDGRFVVGFHGVLSPWYGLDVLVEAAARAARSVPELSLLIVGDGVERARIEMLAREHGIADRTVVTGFVPHGRAPEFVDVFDVGVVADHVWWTSPLKLFEYGAMRKPVVAAAVESISEVAPEGSLLLVSPRDVDALAEALVRLAADPVERERLAATWHATVMAEFVRDHLGARLLEILDGVVPR